MRNLIIGSTALLCCGGATAAQDIRQCSYSVESYNTTVSNVRSQLVVFSTCLNESQGKDDCTSEFRSLRRAQSELVLAVSTIEANCGKRL